MRRFFYDTEFIEYPNTIDLISIGIVGEDGQEYYAVNKDCDFSKASVWVKQNVISLLPPQTAPAWKPKAVIANEILDVLQPRIKSQLELWGYYSAYDHVVLCWLFGPMVNLPQGMSKYTKDLKQLASHIGSPNLPRKPKKAHDALEDARWNRDTFKMLKTHAMKHGYKIQL